MTSSALDPRLRRLAPHLDAPLPPPAHRAAAVAVVLRPEPGGLGVLLIERAEQPGRRWSGDVAFPGGLAEPGDADLEATARRELTEEVGLGAGPLLGRLPARRTVTPRGWRRLSLTPLVFAASLDSGPLVLEPGEVSAAFWAPLRALRGRRSWALRPVGGIPLPFPERAVARRRVWGLTLSMLESLDAALLRAKVQP